MLRNIRFYVLVFSSALAALVYLYVRFTIPDFISQLLKLEQLYALISITYLYFALLATPLTRVFYYPSFRNKYVKARRALGVSAFFFGLIHSSIAFFGELGGFNGLGFLDNKYLFSIFMGFITLFIMSYMALTSFDFIIAKLTFRKWKFLHRFIYLGALTLLIHTLMLGSHFIDLSGTIPQIFFGALVIFLVLEALRFDEYLKSKFINLPNFGISFAFVLALIAGISTLIYVPLFFGNAVPAAFNIHSAHLQLAKQAQQNSSNLSNINANLKNFPGLQGDPTRRFTVSFLHDDNIQQGQDTNLKFQVYDAATGNPIQIFNFVYSKQLHLIIVDSELNYFQHIHPELKNDGFYITTKFPKNGVYHLYLDFQPLGAIEQQIGFTINMGNVDKPTLSSQQPDTTLTKAFGNYQVTLSTAGPLKSSEMAVGNQKITFNFKDKNTGQPITNLKPYLAAFGHLVMINEQTFDYLHIHPSNLVAPAPDANGGPDVEFIPLGLYGPIKPGVYRVFAQFNPNNQLLVADFTIKVE